VGTVVLILLVVFVALSLLLAALTLFLQGYFNETPPDLADLAWRAPAAAAAVTIFAAVWCFLAYGNPAGFAPVTEFSTAEDHPLPKRLWAVQGGRTTEYALRHDERGREVYLSVPDRQKLEGRPTEVIIEEEDEKVSFKPDTDADGNFVIGRDRLLRYHDDRGREMLEGYWGQLTTRRGGVVYFLFVVVLHFAVWLGVSWPLLGYARGQAVVMALSCWLIMTFAVMPPLLDRAMKAGQARQKEAQQQEARAEQAGA
jgi:hypothetical protein